MGYGQWLTLDFNLPKGSDVEQFKARIKEILKMSDEDWQDVDIQTTLETPSINLHFDGWNRIYDCDGFFGNTLVWNEEKRQLEIVKDVRVDLREVSRQLDCDIELLYQGEDSGDAERMTIKKGVVTSHEEMTWVNKLQPTAAS